MQQSIIGLLRTMRPKQWTKNILIFGGIVFDGQLFDREAMFRVITSFILFCLAASTVYIVNDLLDIERDRQHPKKKYRPIPSGQFPIPLAIGAAIGIPIFSVLVALSYSHVFAAIVVIYIVINLLYSYALKHIVLIDVLTITASYVLRVAAGVFVIQVDRFSPWLYAITALGALFLATSKRRQELVTLGADAAKVRPIFKHYNLPLLDEMLRIVTTGTLIAYILYTIEAPSVLLRGSNLALTTVPFVLYGLLRYLYLIHVKGEGSAPDEVVLQDRPLQTAIILWVLAFIVILYVVPRILNR